MNNYIPGNRVTHIRIFTEGGTWNLDGADDNGNFTESVWNYDSAADAEIDVNDFCNENGIPLGLPVKFLVKHYQTT